MIRLPSCYCISSSYFPPYFCFKSRNFSQAEFLRSFISPKNSHTTFHSQPSLRTQTNSNPESFLQYLLSAITSCQSSSSCQAIHAKVVKSLNYRDGFIGDRLVSLYAELGCSKGAHQLFDEIAHKDLVSWNSLISAFSRNGCFNNSLNVFLRMRLETALEPNEVTLICIIAACTNSGALDEGTCIHGFAFKIGLLRGSKVVNSLINMYGKFGYLGSACRLFKNMLAPNIVTWNSIIMVHVLSGSGEKGIGLFNHMRRAGICPDRATMVTLLQGCADMGVGQQADSLHGYILHAGLIEDVSIATGLLTVYAKSGRLDSSCEVFGGIKNPDRIAWTAMLAGFALHGYGRKVMELFELMVSKGQEPDHVTFTHLLSACSHSGLVEEGRRYFQIMSSLYRVQPRLDHYSCMVDLFGRSGHLKDALALIESMPMEPNSGVWGALLNACNISGNLELGKEVAERLFAQNPSDRRNYLMLSNIYSAAGQWRNASKVRTLLKERGLLRSPGCSYIEHGHKIHRFVVADRSHPCTEKIYMKLEEVIRKIQIAGYVPKTEFVLHDVDEETREDMISKHSEKLAIAFGLMVTGAGKPLIITKNLRICGDCHRMAKFVSLIERRMIIIRDAKRFHHFANGSCSCGDYW